MVAHAFNPSTRLWVQSLHAGLQDSQGYVDIPCLKRGEKEEILLFEFCQSIAKVADVSTYTCGGGE